MTPDPEKVKEALAVWKRHRRNGSMPPIRTLQVLVGAARSGLSGTDIQWCEEHISPPLRDGWDDGGFRNPDGSSRCAVSFLLHEGYDDDYDIPCRFVSRRLSGGTE